ncbi:MAG: hypothetical protein ACI8P3_002988 [Saprospiraceae bacterium]|jgi:hypothetical protein
MKLHWGNYIAIFYTCFVCAMIFMVFKSTQNKMDLVQENYYQKDLDYESFRSKRQNSTELSEQVSVSYSIANKAIELSFPEEMKTLKGKLILFRPSNKLLDKTFLLKLDKHSKMSIPVDGDIPPGLWKVQLDWEAQGSNYYKEESIVI